VTDLLGISDSLFIEREDAPNRLVRIVVEERRVIAVQSVGDRVYATFKVAHDAYAGV